MTVFIILVHRGCENPWCPGTELAGVFSSREKAEAHADSIKAKGHIEIVECSVNKVLEG